MEETPLYEDDFIVVTESTLTIKRYYFPLCNAKRVDTSTIECVWRGEDEQLGLNAFKKKTMGVALSDVWWAWKVGREWNDDKYNMVIRVRGDRLRHGFSVEQPDQAYDAIMRVAALARRGDSIDAELQSIGHNVEED